MGWNYLILGGGSLECVVEDCLARRDQAEISLVLGLGGLFCLGVCVSLFACFLFGLPF